MKQKRHVEKDIEDVKKGDTVIIAGNREVVSHPSNEYGGAGRDFTVGRGGWSRFVRVPRGEKVVVEE